MLKVRFVLFWLWILAAARSFCGDSVVVFNEVMYHPASGDAIEWVELYNQMSVDVDISGWRIDGIDYLFPTNSIVGGGKYIVVASEPAELARRSGLSNVYGPFAGKLANEGERLRLLNHNGRVIDSVDYETEAPWPSGPDGSGFTLAKRQATSASKSAENWTPSSERGGTPGVANFSSAVGEVPIFLNEIAASTNATFWLELVNRSSAPVNIGGAQVAFSRGQNGVYKIPADTALAPGAFYTLYPTGYLATIGEKIFLLDPAGQRLWDSAEVSARLTGRSDASGNEWLYPERESPGASNVFALRREVVINEIMYARVSGQTNTSWIELYNTGSHLVDLSRWKLAPTGFSFREGASIAPGQYLVVAQDPVAFRSRYPDVTAPVFGGFEKALSGNSDHLILEDEAGNPADEVRYFDSAPWPAFADGEGVSLELRDARADHRLPESWAPSFAPGEWQSYSYTATAAADNGPTRWNEFIFGLLDAGEVLLDDFSVLENPAAGGREILQNGSFENGPAAWRFLGTHRNAVVEVDPQNPANHLLHLNADGPTEHMHNHIETTLLGNVPIRNGTSYKISWRARWLRGSHRLNTRLYFNRVARTTPLQRPVFIGTPGAPNSVIELNIGPNFTGLQHFPIVPKAGEAVQLSVRVQDPDGVKRVRLWSGINGTNWAAAEMSPTGGLFAATLPGRLAGTLVQFYIEAEDNRGAVSFYPAAGPSSRALYKVNDNQALSSRTHNFRLLMLPSEAAQLHAATNVMSNGESLCTVIYDEQEVFYNCGLHLQASERGRMDSSRVGFTVNFPADHLFRGVQNTITFDRSGGWSGRGGRQDEIVIRHIINQAGDSPDMYNDLVRVLTPLPAQSGTAMLLMSKYGNEFIDGSVYPKDGSLFKLELIYYPITSVNNDPQLPKIPQPDDVIGSDLGNLGPTHEAYRWFLSAENHPADDDYDGLIRMSQSFSLSGAALKAKTDELLDLEEWTRVFAFKSLSGDPDTYGFGLPHNQLFYIPPAGKALTFPWDLDYAWARGASESINVGSKVGQVIHTIPANQRLYLGNIRDILETSYNTNYMARWTAHYGTLAGQNYGGILSYIGQRGASARAQLPALSPFAITTFTGTTYTTNTDSIVLRGTAPYTLKRLQKNNEPPGTGFTWTAAQNWEATIPLNFGSNLVSLVGYDFHNRPIVTNQVTIVSSFGLPDRDHDGMPDDWESSVGLNPDLADADADADGDGLSNLAEYRAGTSPRDANSNLHLSVLRVGEQQFDLSFVAQPGRIYRMQYRVGLSAAWSDLLTFPAGVDPRVVVQRQTVAAVAPALFYRVILQTSPL